MNNHVRITFHGIEPSAAIEDYVRKRATKLEKLCRRISRCNVILERPHAHKHHGAHYRVRIDIATPGAALVISRAPEQDTSREDMYAAIDAAFEDAGRVLKTHVERQRGDIKTHA